MAKQGRIRVRSSARLSEILTLPGIGNERFASWLVTFEKQPAKSPLHPRMRVDYNFWCPNTFRGAAGDPR